MVCRRFYSKCSVFYLNRIFGSRNFCTKRSLKPEMDEAVKHDIESEKIKARKHSGVMKIGNVLLPKHIVDAVRVVVEDHPVSTILNDAKVMANYLFSRHYPWEEEDLSERRSGFTEDVKARIGTLPEDATEDQLYHYNNIVKNSVARLMKKYNYNWSALDFQDYVCRVYLFTRGPANYAAAMRVFNEIVKRCPEYKPTTLFDFGSGVGTVYWAAKTCWGDSIKHVINIESSSFMNNIAELLLKGGNPDAKPPKNVFYRQFLPAQHAKNSLVVCAHSLMELPSRQSRLDLLLNLWNKTEDFLVIIEQGTKSGFKMVLEARDFILSCCNEQSPGHVFAPCPHDSVCPRFLRGPYPCHFQVPYLDLDVGKKQQSHKELVSYVILRRGERPEGNDWPRIVRPVLQRHNHVICRLCTSHGDLREVIFTKKFNGKTLYSCAKRTNWGDFLPIKLPPLPTNEAENPSPSEKLTEATNVNRNLEDKPI